ncbi:hypothetical protein BaRGS_00039403, partial [Batillaria attramentaria]
MEVHVKPVIRVNVAYVMIMGWGLGAFVQMVSMEADVNTEWCHPNGMLVNVFPYGFSERLWYYRRPPTLSRCRIPTVAAFTARWPQFRSRGWRGYAGAYYHRNDPCGRNALVTETDNQYGETYKGGQPSVFTSECSQCQTVVSGITDIRVNRCVITNGVNSIVIAENGCARPPIGRALLKPARGSNVLWISTADFPQGSLNWNFRCRVRTCTSTDLRCRLSVGTLQLVNRSDITHDGGSVHEGPVTSGGSVHEGPVTSGGSVHEGPVTSGGLVHEGPVTSGGLVHEGPVTSGGLVHEGPVTSGGLVHEGPVTSGGLVHEGPVTSGGLVHEGPVTSGGLVHEGPVTSGGSVHEGPVTSGGLVHEGPVTSGGLVHEGPVTSGGLVHEGPVTSGGSVHEGPVTSGGSVHEGPVTSGKSVHEGPVASGGSVHEGPVTSGGSVHEGPVTSAGLVHEGPVTSAGSVHEGPVTSAGLVHEGPVTSGGSVHEGPALCGHVNDDDNTDASCSYDGASGTPNRIGIKNSGPTLSLNTGPDSDHTTGFGHYMYIDARGKMAGDHAVLASPIIDWPATQGCLSFWVSMYGNDVGTLRVKAVETTGMAISQVLWYRTGQLGLGWKEVSFTVDTNVPIRLQFEGERGSGTEGDIAIDDVTVTQGPCVVATTVPPALVPTPPLPGALPMGPDPTGPSPVGALPGGNDPLAALFPGLGGSTNTGPQKPSIPFQSTLQFSCLRPSTPCNEMYGMCESATGRCICFNQNYGLTCDVSAARGQNGGMCQINNPCTRGQCYDDGVGAACAFHTECEDERMVVNIFPYGFNPAVWIFVDPPGTETCDMVAVSTFLAQTPGYHNRGWAGFARAFKYVNDPCAGNASIEWDTDTSTLYSRQLYVYYGIGARHATDNVIKVTCEVAKVIPTPSPGSFPPPRVMVVVKDSRDNPVRGPIRLGFKVKVVFDLNVPNNAGVNDVQVEQCVVRDAFSRFSVDVVKN